MLVARRPRSQVRVFAPADAVSSLPFLPAAPADAVSVFAVSFAAPADGAADLAVSSAAPADAVSSLPFNPPPRPTRFPSLPFSSPPRPTPRRTWPFFPPPRRTRFRLCRFVHRPGRRGFVFAVLSAAPADAVADFATRQRLPTCLGPIGRGRLLAPADVLVERRPRCFFPFFLSLFSFFAPTDAVADLAAGIYDILDVNSLLRIHWRVRRREFKQT